MIEEHHNRQIQRINRLIESAKSNQLNFEDDNVKACIISLLILDEINENHFDFILMEAYQFQPTIFVNALRKTAEFGYYLNLLDGQLSKL